MRELVDRVAKFMKTKASVNVDVRVYTIKEIENMMDAEAESYMK
ncbi:MAG: hypothetical protein QXN24_05760 [Candidatus Bathyarchaeia archaeon]